MTDSLTDLHAILVKMETAVASVGELDAQVLEFLDINYSEMLDDQKVLQMFKNIGDAEDELQRQINFLRIRLSSGIPEFKKICDAAA